MLIHKPHSKALLRVAMTQREGQQIFESRTLQKHTHIYVDTHRNRKMEGKKGERRKLWIGRKPPELGALRIHCLALFHPSVSLLSSCHSAGNKNFDWEILFKCWEESRWEWNSEICKCGACRAFYLFLFPPHFCLHTGGSIGWEDSWLQRYRHTHNMCYSFTDVILWHLFYEEFPNPL